MKKTRIALVDDHQIVIDGIASVLADVDTYEIVGTANNGRDAVQLVRVAQPDLVLMDIDMPIMNGITASKELKKDFPDVKVIILSLHNEKAIIQNLIQIGVNGYLLKNSDKNEVLNAISQVLDGQKYFSSDVTLSLSGLAPSNSIKLANTDPGNAEKLSSLTEREIEILKGIADGMSNRQIGEQLFISQRTVDTHRQNIMKKLEVKKVVGLIKFAIKNGLVE